MRGRVADWIRAPRLATDLGGNQGGLKLPGTLGTIRVASGREISRPDTRSVRCAVPWRALVATALLALLGLALARADIAGHTAAPPAARLAAPGRAQVSSLPAAAQSSISAALGSHSHTYAVSGSAGGFEATSDQRQLRTHFGRSGAQLQSGAIRVGLGLNAIGYGSTLRALGGVQPTAADNRVTYSRAGLDEWYVNGPFGVEQGFTIPRAPAHGAGPLTLSLSLSSNARASLAPDEQGIRFTRPGSASLSYRGLTATDATGRVLHSWLSLGAGRVLLHVDSAGARYPLRIDPFFQVAELTANDEQGPGKFGFSVALSADGTTALIGGPHDGESPAAGAAWVFTRSPGSTAWEQQGPKLTSGESGGSEESCTEEEGEEASECAFGGSVALSADGNTALVGAPSTNDGEGAAWVFTRSGNKWVRQSEALVDDEAGTDPGHLGRSVALSGDGDTALVGAPTAGRGAGVAWVFTRSGNTWIRQAEPITNGQEGTSPTHFGRAVALSSDGDTALVGAPAQEGYSGAAWAFSRSGSAWIDREQLTGSGEAGAGHFGLSLALSGNGQTALVGARSDDNGAGAIFAFSRTGSRWEQQGPKLTAGTEEAEAQGKFGYSAALSNDGNTALIGGPRNGGGAGNAWVFTRSGSTWAQQGTTLASAQAESAREEERHGPASAFGTSVALSSGGETALIGGPHEAGDGPGQNGPKGAVWAFENSPEAPAPKVESVTPSQGPSGVKTKVTIKGSGFLAGAKVTIGSEASNVKENGETEITAVTSETPAPGKYEVKVTNTNGGVSSDGPFFEFVCTMCSPAPPPKEKEKEKEPPATTNFPIGALNSALPGPAAPSKGGPAPVPPPKFGVSSNVQVVSGTVLVKLPGSNRFVPLSGLRQLPFGTIIDATHGKVTITFALPHGGTQTITLSEGEFKLSQARNGAVTATLVGGNFSVCPTARERSHIARTSSSHASSKHVVRKLWANGHAKFSTKGNYASGAVQGTRWLTEDLCGGTLYHVVTDKVLITNFVNHHHVLVKAGHTYLAKAP